MGIEIERKFLVKPKAWQQLQKPQGTVYKQGYLTSTPETTVRVRVAGTQGYITIKGKTSGMSRPEYEYAIPLQDAEEMLSQFAGSLVEKTRYNITWSGKTWEVDEFCGENQGLVVAELELQSESESFDHPDWLADEVTGQKQYYNSYLAQYPYNQW